MQKNFHYTHVTSSLHHHDDVMVMLAPGASCFACRTLGHMTEECRDIGLEPNRTESNRTKLHPQSASTSLHGSKLSSSRRHLDL
ncbi:putative transcription factor interactor and regulator CCHC(Zn) family [Helianthus annuus]|nr:putative transcription factor interactor and regulator CCHC(Zn) family [Helianthus annuus]